jgi:FlaA1/EpsC-like NDP-sugar epimerase
LVTGAGGSIGTPLTSRLVKAGPARLVLVDHHEYSLFSLERAIGGNRPGVSYELADVRDARRLERIFSQHHPDLVVHLAAAKHVPYGERFPESAVATNLLATHSLLELANASDVATLVYPSSDKSVQPPSVYGATKRIAEALVQSAAAGHQRHWAVLRYVNIIGTRGSVVETFTQQVQSDRPMSITDERMTRYWISMDEAIWSVLLTARGAAPGEVVMPACGEAVPIVETARQLAGWYRPERVPYPIDCTGVRPGERLHEVLLSPNESFASDGPAPGLRSVRSTRDPSRLETLPRIVEELRERVDSGNRFPSGETLVAACLAAAEALQ